MKRNHTVDVDSSTGTPRLVFSDTFNVAVRFIDSPVELGRGRAIAIRTTGGMQYTYAELAQHVDRAGAALLNLGLSQGDRLLMVVVDCPMFLFTFWGAIKAGIIPIAVNTLVGEEEYRFLIEDSECNAVVYSPNLARTVRTAWQSSKPKPGICIASDGKDSLYERMRKSTPKLAPAETNRDSECFWLYSSGSTGNPKGVVHTHKSMVATSALFGEMTAGITESDVVYCSSKLFFSFGFGGGMTFPLWSGASTILCDEKMSSTLVIKMLRDFRPTVFFGVPTLYGQLLHDADTSADDFKSLRRAISAGEALPAPLFHAFKERFGLEILDGIGSTEALHIFVSNRPNDIAPGTSGRPVAGYEVKIVDNDNSDVSDGEIGTLWVKGESTAKCYWKNPEKTASTMVGEWLNTGDMYYTNESGYFVNAGRADDMLKVGGMWCSPIEIEACLSSHVAVKEVGVVGKNDDAGMTKPEAYIVLTDSTVGDEKLKEQLGEYCREHLDSYKYPRWFKFVDELPKTVTGKIQRFRLRSDREHS